MFNIFSIGIVKDNVDLFAYYTFFNDTLKLVPILQIIANKNISKLKRNTMSN